MEKTTLVILAGGKSSRFGRDKSLLELNGRRIVEMTVDLCRDTFDDILIVSNDKKNKKFGIPGVPELKDIYKGAGPMGGMHVAFLNVRTSAVFFVACDMPYFNVELAKMLVEQLDEYDACVPRMGGKVEPLFAVYRMSVFQRLVFALDDGRRSLHDFIEEVNTNIVDCDEWIKEHNAENAFVNMNYQEDYDKLVENTANK